MQDDDHFIVTSRLGGTGHNHIAYMREDGTGVTSWVKGHRHQIVTPPPPPPPMPQGPPPGQPPMGGPGMPPGGPGGPPPMQPPLPSAPPMPGMQSTGLGQPPSTPSPVVVPAKDGHTHELLDPVERTPEKTSKSDDEDDDDSDTDKVQRVQDLWRNAKTYDKPSRKKAEESEEFALRNNQWQDNDKALLRAEDRPCLTINLIDPAIRVLSGYQRQNRTDITLLPQGEGDARVADIITQVVKSVCELNDYQYVETEVFDMQCVVGRSFFHSFVDTDEHLEGEIKIESYYWRDVYPGPHEKIDFSDCDYIVKSKWYTKDKLKSMYPEKAEDIQKDFTDFSEGYPVHQWAGGADQYELERERGSRSPMLDLINVKKKEFRVLELEEREFDRVPVLVNVEDDLAMNAEGYKFSDIKAIKTIPGFSLIHRPHVNVKVIKIAGGVILDEDEREGGDFSLTPAYGRKNRDMYYGLVEIAKDPQREVNKRHSQAVDIINKAAANGFFYDGKTFANALEEKKFQERANSPGFKIKLTDSTRPPNKVESPNPPSGILEMGQEAMQALSRVMNVNVDLINTLPGQQSGVAVIEQKRQGMLGNEFLFDNLSYAKKQLGKRLVKLIQDVYSPERIIKIVEQRHGRSPVNIGGQPFDQYSKQELIDLLEDTDLTKYEVVVGESTHSPTKLMANYLMLSEAAKAGISIPPELLIKNMPMPEEAKQEALAAIAQQKQAEQSAMNQKMQMEIQKTQIAHQPKPGEQGQQPQGPGGMTPADMIAHEKMQGDLQLGQQRLELERQRAVAGDALKAQKMIMEFGAKARDQGM